MPVHLSSHHCPENDIIKIVSHWSPTCFHILPVLLLTVLLALVVETDIKVRKRIYRITSQAIAVHSQLVHFENGYESYSQIFRKDWFGTS